MTDIVNKEPDAATSGMNTKVHCIVVDKDTQEVRIPLCIDCTHVHLVRLMRHIATNMLT